MTPFEKTFLVLNFVLFITAWTSGTSGNIHQKVSYHEVIPTHQVHVREKRSVDSFDSSHKEFTFQAFNRTFTCHLRPRTGLFSSDFKLKVYGADGIPHEQKLSTDLILVGTCEGDPDSWIRGTFMGDVFSGTLSYDGQVYGLEDAKHHVPDLRNKPEPVDHMIMYRVGDMIEEKGTNGPSFCGVKLPESTNSAYSEGIDSVEIQNLEKRRKKRNAATVSWNTCRLLAVADYKFFKERGDGKVLDTALLIANMLSRVEDIYRSTEFNINGQGTTGLGIEIAEMRVFDSTTSGFNSDKGNWEPMDLLESFSNDLTLKSFCLGHLFTHQSFSGNTLGMGYIAPVDTNQVGGICSPVTFINGTAASTNSAWTTTRNANGDTVLLEQSYLVTAHEIGHNFGSEHDPTGSCAPSSGILGNGKYLMWYISVSGYDSNNRKFSPCSRDSIGRVLASKGPYCFTAKTFDDTIDKCGNSKRDEGEQCDGGFLSRMNLDNCCRFDCRYTEGAQCSLVNDKCCDNCRIADTTKNCRANSTIGCLMEQFCDGINADCPASDPKPDTTPCLDEGQCFSGVCLAFCEARNKTSCACSEVSESCQRCCRDNETAECKPFDNEHPLPDDRPCANGYCSGGVCIKTDTSTIQRLFNFLDNLDIDGVAQFFKDNLVGTIMVFSLVLWIPASITITCLDRKRRNRLNRSEEIEIRKDRELLYDEDGRKVPSGAIRPITPSGLSPRYRNANFTDLGGFGSEADA